jgi:hypothetical protein
VTLSSGKIVKPTDVLEEKKPSQCFVFIFGPDKSYLKDFLN